MRKDLKDETDNILSEEGFESAFLLDYSINIVLD